METKLNVLVKEHYQLLTKTKKFLEGSNAEEKEEKLQLLDKTGEYADLQA